LGSACPSRLPLPAAVTMTPTLTEGLPAGARQRTPPAAFRPHGDAR